MGFFGASGTKIDPFFDFYRFRYLYPRSTGQAGTGGLGSIDTGGALCNSGTSTSGYGRVTITSSITTHSPFSGSAIDFDLPMQFGLTAAFSLANTNCAARFIVGGNAGVPATSDNNALSARGFGVEFVFQNAGIEARLFCHDGTTYSTSAYVAGVATTGGGLGHYLFGSDGLGNIFFDYTNAGSNAFTSSNNFIAKPSRALTLTGGPTGASGGNGSFDIAAVNSSASAPTATCNLRTFYQVMLLG